MMKDDLALIEWRRVAIRTDEPLSLVEKMVLVAEDRRFFRHNGVDFRACLRESIKMITSQPHGGASTIDMQFVRTATDFREKTIRRKLYEMLLAFAIQSKFSKLEILRSYLACAYFGSHVYGVQSASRKMYQKNHRVLNAEEASELAAMLVYPRPLHPSSGWEMKVRRRARYLREQYPPLFGKIDSTCVGLG